MKTVIAVLALITLTSCGNLDKKTIRINPGDSRETVLNIVGTPQDRQFDGVNEAWQYCVFEANGYNDHKIIWFVDGAVAGITSYTTHGAACTSRMKEIKWEEAPDFIIEARKR